MVTGTDETATNTMGDTMEKMKHARLVGNVYVGTEENGRSHMLTVVSCGILFENEKPYIVLRDAQTADRFDANLTPSHETAVVDFNGEYIIIDTTTPILTADGRF